MYLCVSRPRFPYQLIVTKIISNTSSVGVDISELRNEYVSEIDIFPNMLMMMLLLMQLGIPCGAFHIGKKRQSGEDETVVLLSAGVGITPVMAMLEHLLRSNDSGTQIVLVQIARSGELHPMKDRVEELASKQERRLRSFVCYTRVSI